MSPARHIGAGITLAVARASVSAHLVVCWNLGSGSWNLGAREWTAVRRDELRRLAAAMAVMRGPGLSGPGSRNLQPAPSISPAVLESVR
ncbi:MAG: hypothetical protein ABSG76_14810 [Xanthobacteraceae bacterium]